MLDVAPRHRYEERNVSGINAAAGAHGFSGCALCDSRDCANCVMVKRFITAASLEYLPACAECALQSER